MPKRNTLLMRELLAIVVSDFEDTTGQLHDIHSLSYDQYQHLHSPPRDDEGRLLVDEMDHLRGVVKELIPTLPETELGKLTVHSSKLIIAAAAKGIEAVEAAFPNVVRPAGEISPA